jgi:FeS assembly SUF system protein
MGLFSFLTGKKDEGESMSATAVATPPPPVPAATPAAPPVAAPPSPASVPAATGASANMGATAPDAGWDTPFTAPEAWNTGALTTPVEAPATETPEVGPADPQAIAELQAPIAEAIKTVYDPEIPVDIYELGLIYDIIVDKERRVLVKMTLTSPACPSAQQLPSEVRYKVKAVPGVTNAWVEIVWEPAWSKDRMSETAKLSLGFF